MVKTLVVCLSFSNLSVCHEMKKVRLSPGLVHLLFHVSDLDTMESAVGTILNKRCNSKKNGFSGESEKKKYR